ncbi:MAG: response regulator [Nitrospinota bacterium]|nr:response regulator [Nitrospinota bacterium]
MKSYILENKKNMIDAEVKENLKKGMEHKVEELELPENHEDIYPIFADKEDGIIFIPAIWTDLYCVKIINEVEHLKGVFGAVIVGKTPKASELVVAFNEGLYAYLETPMDKQNFKQTLTRVFGKLRKKSGENLVLGRIKQYESGLSPRSFSHQMHERDHLLAKAYIDVLKDRGPLMDGTVKVLLVTASKAQEGRLEKFLKELGLKIESVDSMAAALEKASVGKFELIITDNMLPDGDAITFVDKLRKLMKKSLPRVIVWSSSPEKFASLLGPENHIDDVILKPGPGAGIEVILPSIVAAIYSLHT